MPYHHWIGVNHAFARYQHFKTWLWIWRHRLHVTKHEELRWVYLILKDQNLYPYHYPQVHSSCVSRLSSSPILQVALAEHECDPGFLRHILWSDKAAFTHEDVFNSHNIHLWAQHNLHLTHYWSINVWVGIIGNCVARTYLPPNCLNAPVYWVFLQEMLPVLHEDLSMAVCCNIWLQ